MRKQIKMSSKFAIENENVLQLLGSSFPRPPTGAPPLDPAGGLPSPRPPRSLVQFKNLVKKALICFFLIYLVNCKLFFDILIYLLVFLYFFVLAVISSSCEVLLFMHFLKSLFYMQIFLIRNPSLELQFCLVVSQ